MVKMEYRLGKHEIAILEALGEGSGFLTKRVVEKMDYHFSGNGRQRSGAVRSWLMALQKQGFVKYLDDQKPVCWERTAAGTEALFRHGRIKRPMTDDAA